jgi:hypothetical protein
MPSSWKPIIVGSTGVLLLTGALLVLTLSPADAQCGSQASSCKNCHEVQALDPVNSEGDWHVSHAFGDFCEFCHAGNVQAPEANLAHEGMVDPLADPAASCSACHPADARDLAVVYGTALGVEVGTGGAPLSSPTPGDAPTPAPTAVPPAIVDEPPAADQVDYNAVNAGTEARSTPIGNVILGVLIALIVVGGGGYVVWNERRRRNPSSDAASPSATPAHTPTLSQEASPLLSAIAALDPLGRRGLEQLLRDPQTASDLLYRLARLDPEMIRTLRGLDRETRALLLALTSD